MSKTFRNHLIFAVLAAIVFVISVAMFMNFIFGETIQDWVIDIYLTSFIMASLMLYLPLFIAAESMVYALKFIIEICLCYKKTKAIKWLNIANILASTLIFTSYTLALKEDILSDPAYFGIAYSCSAAIVGIGIASIVILAVTAKKTKSQNV